MCQHVCYWRTIGANKAKIKMGCKCEHKVSPSLANLCELVPPAFAHPVCFPWDGAVVNMTSVHENWSTEIEHVEERIIVENVDQWMKSWGSCFDPKQENAAERSIPPEFGLMVRHTSAATWGLNWRLSS